MTTFARTTLHMGSSQSFSATLVNGAFGVAALGAVFSNRLLAQLRASASPAVLKLLKGGSITENPMQIHALPAHQRDVVIAAFSHALQTVFIVAVPFAVVGFVLCWFLKETPLRNTAFVATAPRPGSEPDDHDDEYGNGSNGHEAQDGSLREVHELPSL